MRRPRAALVSALGAVGPSAGARDVPAGRSDLTSAVFQSGRPAIVEVPQPGLVISPLSGCAAESFIVLRVSLVET